MASREHPFWLVSLHPESPSPGHLEPFDSAYFGQLDRSAVAGLSSSVASDATGLAANTYRRRAHRCSLEWGGGNV